MNIILPQLPKESEKLMLLWLGTPTVTILFSVQGGFQRPNDACHFLMLQLRLCPAVAPCLGKSVIVEAWPQMLKERNCRCLCLRIDIETGIWLTVHQASGLNTKLLYTMQKAWES